jgi:hypothetical protein
MRHALIIGLIAFAPLAAAQDSASPQQTRLLTAVARCLIPGLPQDWYEAQVVVTLDEMGASSGAGRYTFTRQLSRGDPEPFTPCGYANPPELLLETRKLQEPEQRNWKSVRFVLHRDGKFDLTYDYPKPAPKD